MADSVAAPRMSAPFRFLLAPDPSAVGFAVRTAAAALAALYIAYRLQLESPPWAAATVFIVSQPTPGMVAAKGVYRALGTVAGVAVAVLLTALFAQAAWGFIGAMALWLSLCVYLATLLRGFRSYGAVLAGYTAAIIGFGYVATPDRMLEAAISRGSAILLGIACAGLASGIFSRSVSKRELLDRLRRMTADAARAVRLALAERESAALHRRLVAELAGVIALFETAAAEAHEIRIRGDRVRAIIAGHLVLLSAARAIEAHLVRLEPDRSDRVGDQLRLRTVRVEDALERVEAALIDPALRAGVASDLAALRADLRAAGPDSADAPDRQIVLTRLEEAAAAVEDSLAAYDALLAGRRGGPRVRLVFHTNPAQARRNALRAFVAILLAGAFWLHSAWPSGSSFLATVCIACTLFATQEHPSAGAISFLIGLLWAAPFAFAVGFLVLPRIEGFFMLALVLAPVMIGGSLALADPCMAAKATAFNVFFVSMLQPTNPMHYDAAGFFNGLIATVLAVALGAYAFRILLPTSNARRAALGAREMRRAVVRLIRTERPPARTPYESLACDRLAQFLPPAPTADPALFEAGSAALEIGLCVLRLHSPEIPPSIRARTDPALDVLADALRGERPVPEALTRIGAAETTLMGEAEARMPEAARIAAAELRVIRESLAAYPEFFARGDKA